MTENKRRHERYDSLNLISYVCLDSDGKEWMQGMGRTLNISETGLQLETHEPIESKYVVLLSIGMEDDLVDIRGKVVYCNRGKENKFESGIEFLEVPPEAYTILKRYINEFHKQYTTEPAFKCLKIYNRGKNTFLWDRRYFRRIFRILS